MLLKRDEGGKLYTVGRIKLLYIYSYIYIYVRTSMPLSGAVSSCMYTNPSSRPSKWGEKSHIKHLVMAISEKSPCFLSFFLFFFSLGRYY